MKKSAILCVVTLFSFGTTLQAEETPRQIIERCFAASSAGDLKEVQNAAKELKKLRFIENNRDRIDASYCLKSAYDEKWIYSKDLNRMISSRLRNKIFELSDALKNAKDAHADLNSNRIATEIYQSCVALYEEDSTSAMTKRLCVESFRQNLHPTVTSRSDFISETLKAELQSMNNEDQELILEALQSD